MIVFERWSVEYSVLICVLCLFVGAVADRYYITCVRRPFESIEYGSCRGLVAGGKPRLKVYTWLP